jgi:hypothetical protein
MISFKSLSNTEKKRNVLSKKRSEEQNQDLYKNNKLGLVLKVLIIILSVFLYIGLFLAINILRKHKNILLEPVAGFALFMAIGFLGIGVLIIKILDTKYGLYRSIVLTITTAIFILCILPFLSVYGIIRESEKNYKNAFTDGGQPLPKERNNDFRAAVFSIPDYFYGIVTKDYSLKENIPFYEGKEGVDKGVQLFFDVYTPKGNKIPPEGYPVLIRIHGGGWIVGDKGLINIALACKIFVHLCHVN